MDYEMLQQPETPDEVLALATAADPPAETVPAEAENRMWPEGADGWLAHMLG